MGPHVGVPEPVCDLLMASTVSIDIVIVQVLEPVPEPQGCGSDAVGRATHVVIHAVERCFQRLGKRAQRKEEKESVSGLCKEKSRRDRNCCC